MIDKNNRLLYWRRGKGKWGDGIFEGGACLFHATLHMICFGRYLWVQWNCQRKEKCNVCCERNSSKEVNVILIILYIAMVYPPSCLCLCISTGVKYSLKKRLIYAHFAVTLASWQKVINEHWWVQFEMMGGGQLRRFKDQASPTGKTEISVFFLLQFLLQRLVVRFFSAKVWWVQVQVCCRWQWNYQQSQVCWYTNILLGWCQNLNHIPELTDSERCWQSVRSTERKAWWGTSLPPSSKGSSARRRWESWWWGWTLLARPQSSTNLSLGRLWRPSLP